MPIYDDDETSAFEDPRPSRRDHQDSWDFELDPDARDIVPDDLATVRCGFCKKLIFEDALRCPYCRNLQLDSQQNRKPLWFWLTAVFCILAIGGIFSALLLLGSLPWHTK